MNVNSITQIAGLIGEPGRIRMLTTLLDDKTHSASELAMAADVSAQTASSHLSKLLEGGLIVAERQGRQRLYRLRDSDVANAIEALGALAPPDKPAEVPELRFARSCYDHLAGVLAIAMRNQLLKRDSLRQAQDSFTLTKSGERFLADFGIDVEELRQLRRSFAGKCLDWTERHHHIGGSVGAALLSRFLELKWLARMRKGRAVRVTLDGERGFERVFGIRCRALGK